MTKQLLISIGLIWCLAAASAADWNQWRGSNRNGVAPSSPPLIRSLPAEGIEPIWISEGIPSGGEGGWSSTTVMGDKVYLFAHVKTKLSSAGDLTKKRYPFLALEKRGHLTAEEYKQYEVERRKEDFQIGNRHYEFIEYVYCIDLATGETLWKNRRQSVYSRKLQSGTPAVIGERLIVLGAGRMARCLDARTGKDLWQTRLPGDFHDEFMMSSFAVADGAAVVLAGRLFGLDVQSGDLLWEGNEKTTRGTHSSPVVWRSAGKRYMICNVAGGETICLEPRNGKELWRVHSEAGLSTPVIQGDYLITYGNSRKKGLQCFRISADGAEPLWKYQGLADKGSSPVVFGGHVYAQGENRLACVDLRTGKENWRTLLNLKNPQYTSLVAADGMIIYAHDGLLCFEANPEYYQPLVVAKFDSKGLLATEATFRERLGLDELERSSAKGQEKAMVLYQKHVGGHGPLRCSSPAIAGGRLIVRFKGALACYDLTDPTTVTKK